MLFSYTVQRRKKRTLSPPESFGKLFWLKKTCHASGRYKAPTTNQGNHIYHRHFLCGLHVFRQINVPHWSRAVYHSNLHVYQTNSPERIEAGNGKKYLRPKSSLVKSGLFWESPDFQRSKKITLFFWAVCLGVKGVPVTFGEVAA